MAGGPVLRLTDANLGFDVNDIKRRLERLESSPRIAATNMDHGALTVTDAAGTVQITIGYLPDGTIGIKVGGLTLEGTGTDANKLLGLATLILSGALTAASATLTGTLTADKLQTANGSAFRIFAQASDPAASASEGDIWIQG